MVVAPATVPAAGYAQPAQTVTKGQVVDLSPAQVTALGSSNLRAVATTTMHDQLGEAAGVSNGD